MRRAGLACFALLVLATTQLPAQSYDYLARTLADDVDGETPVRIGMGDFVYAQTRQQSPFSTLLRMELEAADGPPVLTPVRGGTWVTFAGWGGDFSGPALRLFFLAHP